MRKTLLALCLACLLALPCAVSLAEEVYTAEQWLENFQAQWAEVMGETTPLTLEHPETTDPAAEQLFFLHTDDGVLLIRGVRSELAGRDLIGVGLDLLEMPEDLDDPTPYLELFARAVAHTLWARFPGMPLFLYEPLYEEILPHVQSLSDGSAEESFIGWNQGITLTNQDGMFSFTLGI